MATTKTETGEAKARAMKKISFPALIETLVRRQLNFYPFGDDAILELYRWMVISADRTRWTWPTRWGQGSLRADLGGHTGCTNVSAINPLDKMWQEDISRRLSHALFDDGHMAEWRSFMRIDRAGFRLIPIVGAGRGYDLRRSMGALLNLPGRKLRRSLNMVHPKAKEVARVEMWIHNGYWSARMGYGYDGLVWWDDYLEHTGVLGASQRTEEPVGDFVERAIAQFEKLLLPVAAVRR